MKRMIIAAALLALTACGDGDSTEEPAIRDNPEGNVAAVTVNLPDGTTTTCVVFDAYNGGGGISCDWGGTGE